MASQNVSGARGVAAPMPRTGKCRQELQRTVSHPHADRIEEGTSAGGAATEGTQAEKVQCWQASHVRRRFSAKSCGGQDSPVAQQKADGDGVSPEQGSLQVLCHGVP